MAGEYCSSEKAAWGERDTGLVRKEGTKPLANQFPEPASSSVPPFSLGMCLMAPNTGVCYPVYLLRFSEHSARYVVATESLLLNDWMSNLLWLWSDRHPFSKILTVGPFQVFLNFWALPSSVSFQVTVQLNFKSPKISCFISLLLGQVNWKTRSSLGSRKRCWS